MLNRSIYMERKEKPKNLQEPAEAMTPNLSSISPKTSPSAPPTRRRTVLGWTRQRTQANSVGLRLDCFTFITAITVTTLPFWSDSVVHFIRGVGLFCLIWSGFVIRWSVLSWKEFILAFLWSDFWDSCCALDAECCHFDHKRRSLFFMFSFAQVWKSPPILEPVWQTVFFFGYLECVWQLWTKNDFFWVFKRQLNK